MGKVVVFTQPRTVEFESFEDPPLGPHEVRVRTLYSAISAGTELTAYRGSNPYLLANAYRYADTPDGNTLTNFHIHCDLYPCLAHSNRSRHCDRYRWRWEQRKRRDQL